MQANGLPARSICSHGSISWLLIRRQNRVSGKPARKHAEASSIRVDPGGRKKYQMSFLEEAPVLIVVVFDPDRKGLGDFFGQHHGAMQAASACAQNIMLAATDNGYESVWFTFFEPNKMQAALNIPDNLEIVAIIPIGKPAMEIKVPPRKPPVIHKQRYGNTD